jgi:FAD/FMN-containing dehydrogenase/glycerophosphoryl diester phosphodiesterase
MMKKILIILGMTTGFILYYLNSEPYYTPTAIINTNQTFLFPRFIAHKALISGEFSGNSDRAIQAALASPVEGIEVDVRLSAEGIPFLYHGDSLEEMTDGKGVPEEKRWKELAKLTYRDGVSKLLTLDTFLSRIRGDKKVFLDIKDKNVIDSGMSKVVSNLIKKYHLQEQVIVESFNPFFLGHMRLENREIIIMFDFVDDAKAIGEEKQEQFDQIPWLLKKEFFLKQIRRILRPDLLGPRFNVDSKLLEKYKANGYPLIAWTVDDLEESKKLFSIGVDGVQSNRPLELMQESKHYPVTVHDAGGTKTAVHRRIFVTKEEDVIKAFQEAKKEKKQLSIAGRRHTMGAQSASAGSINLDMMTYNKVIYDPKTKRVRVFAGATWRKIQNILNQVGRSVIIMQSDNIFTAGGSLGVNVHGWQVGLPPIGSTVHSLKVFTPSGKIQLVTKESGGALFRSMIGGYGLFGLILEAEFETFPNSSLTQHTQVLKVHEFEKEFEKNVTRNPNVELAYGRLSLNEADLLTEATLVRFVKTDVEASSELSSERLVALKRGILRLSERSDQGKSLRWALEKKFLKLNEGTVQRRNSVMSPDIHVLWPIQKGHKDILHEYFIPKGKVAKFIEKLRSSVKQHGMNLLNVTIREVRKDETSLLPYANTDVFAFVLLFSQEASEQGEANMHAFTLEVINGVNLLCGSFYLPYRLHYGRDQLLKSYPMIREWLKEKRRVDPDDIFSNGFYEHLKMIMRNDE